MEPYRFLPSERIAMTIEEFLEGCRTEPMLAADQLHQGYFEPWLRDAGRPDLAEAAVQVRHADIGPGPALEQFLQAATLAPPSRRRKRRLASARVVSGGLPSYEETLMDAAPNEEVNSPPVAESPSVTRAAPRKARRGSSRRRKLTDEQAREVTRLYAETDTPVEAIARQFGIGQSSIYRLAQQRGARRAAREEVASSSAPAAESGRHGPVPPSKRSLGDERRAVRAPLQSRSRPWRSLAVSQQEAVWDSSSG